MKIKSLYDAEDEIPEAFRPLYEERGGKYHLAQVEGIVTQADVERVQRALTSERTEHGKLRQTFTGLLGERKVEDLQSILDRLPELEAAASGKVDEVKLNELAEARARSKLAPVERAKSEAERRAQELAQRVEQYETRERTRTVHDSMRAAAVKSKMLDTAQEDALLLAERVFEVAEDGKVVTRDGISGVQPGLSPDVWLQDMQRTRPHWWPASGGAGARGGGGGGFANNPWMADTWNMTEQGRIIRENGMDRANQMAKSAGTTVGGQRPVKK